MPDIDNLGNLALANRFYLVIDGGGKWDLGFWSSASGLDVTWGICEYRAGETGNARWYFPAATKYTDIQLSRAACPDSVTVQKWLSSGSIKESRKKFTGELYLADSENTKVVSWKLRNVMPLKWGIEKFDSSASKVALETLTLAHEGFLEDETQFKI